jgi:hypothetical protein
VLDRQWPLGNYLSKARVLMRLLMTTLPDERARWFTSHNNALRF